MLTRSRVQGAAGRPAVPAASDPSLKSCGVDQLSRPTQRRVRGAVGWNRSPGRLGPAPELTQEQPAIPALLVSVPSWGGVDQLSRPTQTRVRGAAGMTSYPANSARVRADAGRPVIAANTVPVRGAVGSTRCPGRLGPGSEELWSHKLSRPTRSRSELPQGRPALPADSHPGPRSSGVDQLSWPTPSWVLTYTGSTIYPGPYGPSSELTPCR